jgi:hypothetical protein
MSKFQELANKLFARSAKYGQVRGDGEWFLLSKCQRVWQVRLYPTREARDEQLSTWNGNGCGSGCSLQHTGRRLTFAAQPETRPAYRQPGGQETRANTPKLVSLVDVLKETL